MKYLTSIIAFVVGLIWGWFVPLRWRIGFIFAVYDFWVGAYYDRKNRRLYILPLPMIGFYFERNSQSEN